MTSTESDSNVGREYVATLECDPIDFVEVCGNDLTFKSIFSSLVGRYENLFFEKYFEKQPVLFKRHISAPLASTSSSLFSQDLLLSTVRNLKLESLHNFNAVYFNGSAKECVDVPSTQKEGCYPGLRKAFARGCTVQFFQPQRFSDPLSRVNASFEHVFGTLAGASIYATPPLTQGLAPHYDDVEVFIIQLEGSKKWHVWDHSYMAAQPGDHSMLPLPEDYSHDLDSTKLPVINHSGFSLKQSNAKKPKKSEEHLRDEKCSELVLEQGDMLYMPRGTIHEAIALDEFSTHVTISVYQYYNYKSLISRVLQPLVEQAFGSLMGLRQGLPRQLGLIAGSGARLANELNTVSKRTSQAELKGEGNSPRDCFLRTVRNVVKDLPQFLTDNIIDTAVDQLNSDFIANRLPPPDLARNVWGTNVVTETTSQPPAKRKRNSKEESKESQLLPTKSFYLSPEDSYELWVQFVEGDKSWEEFSYRIQSLQTSTGLDKVAKRKSSIKGRTNRADSSETSAEVQTSVTMCDPMSMHVEVIQVEGVTMLSISSSRFNCRLAHMGHPIPDSLLVRHDGDDSDNSDNLSEESSDSLAPWMVTIPLRLHPIFFYLMKICHDSGACELSALQNLLNDAYGIGPEEVSYVVRELVRGGLVLNAICK